MLGNAIEICPEDYWDANRKLFYMAYHCLVFLDYYLTIPHRNFSSPLPYTIIAPENIPVDAIDDLVPDRFYSKKELLQYLQSSRDKCYKLIKGLTEEKLNEKWIEEEPGIMNYSVLEILLYNMRHVQHHTAQLNLLLRQGINNAPGWIGRSKDDL
ncbi:MAG: DinB family protein [Bacteroidota bacterium]